MGILDVMLVTLAAAPDGGVAVKEIPPKQFYGRALESAPQLATAEQTAQWLRDKGAVLVDVRSAEDFARRHIRGAVSLPLTDLTEENLRKVAPRKDAPLILYCDDQLFPSRRVALTTLGAPTAQQLGYAHVYRLENLWSRQDYRFDSVPSTSVGGLFLDPR